MVMMPGFHPGGPGSSPGVGIELVRNYEVINILVSKDTLLAIANNPHNTTRLIDVTVAQLV